MMKIKNKRLHREQRHRRIRAKIKGTAERPRLSVFRSNRRLWVQLIDDTAGHTSAAAGSWELQTKKKEGRMASAENLGVLVAKRAAEKNIKRAVFDRGSYQYHGLIRALAEGVRKAGLKI